MSEPLLTKRLHISGFTQSITPADLQRRLSSFGKVKAMEGFGARDSLGDPRKFGFVTMEISAKGLAKCLNVLSGSTWKGAKLRIGEAKPDYRERLAQINSRPPRPVRPKRTHARNSGRPSSTLPLTPLSVTAAASTPGWTVTPSGRVVRPMRMRPERPLEPTCGKLNALKIKCMSGKVKKRVKPPPVQARRRLIDPTKWESVYLKGVFLDDISVPVPASNDELPAQHDIVDEGDEGDEDRDSTTHTSRHEVNPSQPLLGLDQDRADPTLSSKQPQEVPFAISLSADVSMDIRGEADAALAMLDKMFGDKEEWDRRESVDEMDDSEDNGTREKKALLVEDDEIEIVPRDSGETRSGKMAKKGKGKGKGKGKEKLAGLVDHLNHEHGVILEETCYEDVEMEVADSSANIEVPTQTAEPAPNNLKALFAPREEASFSLLDHLELDLELDTDVLGISSASGASQENGRPSEPNLPPIHVAQIPAIALTTKAHSQVTLDHSFPLLFPPLGSLPHPHEYSCDSTAKMHQHDTPSCILFPSTIGVRGLHHLPPSISFTRLPQDTPEFIRERWEKDKTSLTHEWKKAWREARGSRRGRVGARGDVGSGY